MENEKYVVLKLTDVNAFLEDADYGPMMGVRSLVEMCALPDAVVIRTQDAFSAAGLSGYAHLVDFALQGDMSEKRRKHLEVVRNYFHSVAQEAEDRLARGECKLPD
jgi:hypothetical protein